jgi:NTP pyrophosphatase (non-canonical NTP hydrolase)
MNMPSKKQEDLATIFHMALGLERRFPMNNSVFSYGTRLCEETGELAEILSEIQDRGLTVERKQHLIKEAEDVLQIIQGVLGIYELNNRLPSRLEDFFASKVTTPTKNDVICLAILAGKFADAINHIENQGVKSAKHAQHPEARLSESASNLTERIICLLQSYGVIEDFKLQIQKDYIYLLEAGNIPTEFKKS